MPPVMAHYGSINGLFSASGLGRKFLTWGSGTPLRSDFNNVLWASRKGSNDPHHPHTEGLPQGSEPSVSLQKGTVVAQGRVGNEPWTSSSQGFYNGSQAGT